MSPLLPLLPLKVLVPRSVANGSVYPAMGVQYGHGLFGDQVEKVFLSLLLLSLLFLLPVSLLPLLFFSLVSPPQNEVETGYLQEQADRYNNIMATQIQY